jgi:RNA polymerase sigma-70 factor (ECF subfamily)
MSIDDEKDIVRRAQNGDADAFSQLYEEYFDKVYRYVYLRLRNPSEVEDLTQEIFVKALEALGSYKWRNLPFSSWLFRIAHNHVIDHLRKEGKLDRVDWQDNMADVREPDPAQMAEQRLQLQELRDNIEKLSPAQRSVIYLRFAGGLSVAEVAQILGKSPGTVKALQHSGIAALRKMISPQDKR